MKPRLLGFYWTLPVPWAGFRDIDRDIDKAAAQSRTIALQREVIRRWARDHCCEIVEEAVHLELAPDRGTVEIVEPLETLVAKAEALGACIAYVDFGSAIQQRSHHVLREFVDTQSGLFEAVWPAEAELEAFRAHFDAWRTRTRNWQAAKPQRAAAALEAALAFKAKGLSAAASAEVLNAQGLKSPTGRPWTGANLAKFLKGA